MCVCESVHEKGRQGERHKDKERERDRESEREREQESRKPVKTANRGERQMESLEGRAHL